MPVFSSSEYSIGRGEVAESRVEAPIFAVFVMAAALAVLIVHMYFKNNTVTLAVTVSLLVFGVTIMRVEWGVYFLVVAMLMSPEVGEGDLGAGTRAVNVRYNDILIIVLFAGVMFKNLYEGRGMLWLPTPINRGIVIYYAICIFSTMLAFRASIPLFDKRTAMFVMLKMLEFYMVFVLVGSAIRTQKQINRQLIVFFIVACIVAVFGIHARQFTEEARVGAPFEVGGGEPNTLGGYLVLVICLAAALFIHAPTFRLKFLCLAVATVAFFPMLYTLSRASYIAIIFGLVSLAIASRKYWIVALVALVLAFSQQIMPEDVQKRVADTFIPDGKEVEIAGKQTGIVVDKSTHERIYVWEKVRYNLYVWPWFGGGVTWNDILDSHYARVIIETGLFGLIAFVFLQWRILSTTWKSHKWPADWVGRGLCIGVFAITVALIAHSMGTVTFIIVRIMEPYWFLVALAMVARHIAIEEFRAKQREEAALAPHIRHADPQRAAA